MKRCASIFVLILIISSFAFVIAENSSDSELDVENVKTEFGAIRGTFESETENVFTREIELPNFLSIFFGKTPTIEKLVLLGGIWLILFIIVRGTVEFVPIFEGDKIEVMASIAITALIVLTGTVDNLAYMYNDWISSIVWLGTSSIAKIIFGIILFLPLVFLVKSVFNFMRNSLDKEKARVAGENLGFMARMGKMMNDSLTDAEDIRENQYMK